MPVEIAAPGSPARNDAFDVTPARLITGLITERGVAAASREGLLALYPERRGRGGTRSSSCAWEDTGVDAPRIYTCLVIAHYTAAGADPYAVQNRPTVEGPHDGPGLRPSLDKVVVVSAVLALQH